MKNSFDTRLKGLCVEYCKNGKNSIPVSAGGYKIPEESKPVITDLLKLLYKTGYFREDTRHYLSYHEKTYRTIANTTAGCASNVSASRSRIYTDIGKLKKMLGSDAMDVILLHPDQARLDAYRGIISTLYDKYAGKNLIDGLSFKLNYCETISFNLNDDTYAKLVEICKMHSKKAVQEAKGFIESDTSILGFMRYLDIHKQDLSGVEKERYMQLKNILE